MVAAALTALFFVAAVRSETVHDHLFRAHPLLQAPPEAAGARHGRRMSFKHSVDTEVHNSRLVLEYSGVVSSRHTLRLLEPALAPLIAAIACNSTHVSLQLSASPLALDTLSARFEVGAMITGACQQSGDEPAPFYRTTHAMAACASCSPQTLHFATRNSSLYSAFDSIDLRFHVGRPQKPASASAPSSSSDASSPSSAQQPEGGAATGEAGAGRASRRRLFLNAIGDFTNSLGEGLVDLGGKLLEGVGKAIGIIPSTGAIEDIGGIFDDVATFWNAVSGAVKALFRGLDFAQKEDVTVADVNWDNATQGALVKEIGLFHTAWAKCVDCYLHASLSAELAFSFEAGARPKSFHAEVGGTFDAKASIEVTAPAPAAANDMGNWHALVERVKMGSFSFVVGSVPVTIDFFGDLNAAAWATEDLGDISMSAGIEAHAEAHFGVDWTPADGWRKVQDTDWNHSYWLPKWSVGGAPNASIRAAVSPEIIMLLWGAIPLEIKPKIIVGYHFGSAAAALPAAPSYLALPQKGSAKSMLPPLQHTQQLSHRSFAALDCPANDYYALSHALHVGIGIESVDIPGGLIPGVSEKIEIVPGIDFGEAELLPEAGFPDCGLLCRGCLSRYNADEDTRREYEAAAYEYSEDKFVADRLALQEEGGGMSGWEVAWLVTFFLLLAALLVIALLCARMRRPEWLPSAARWMPIVGRMESAPPAYKGAAELNTAPEPPSAPPPPPPNARCSRVSAHL